jgi:membrane protein DedA with SNARE-associated domain
MSLITTIVVTVMASVIADVAWYGIGRCCGARAVTLLGKLPCRAARRVEAARRRFVAHQLVFLFASRFMPEINPLAAGMAGAMRIPPGRYIAIVSVSALLWAVTWTGTGYALRSVAIGFKPSLFIPPFSAHAMPPRPAVADTDDARESALPRNDRAQPSRR